MVNPNFVSLVLLDLDIDDGTLLTIARKLLKRELYVGNLVKKDEKEVVISLESINGEPKNKYLVIRKTGMPIIPVVWNITSVAPTTENRKT